MKRIFYSLLMLLLLFTFVFLKNISVSASGNHTDKYKPEYMINLGDIFEDGGIWEELSDNISYAHDDYTIPSYQSTKYFIKYRKSNNTIYSVSFALTGQEMEIKTGGTGKLNVYNTIEFLIDDIWGTTVTGVNTDHANIITVNTPIIYNTGSNIKVFADFTYNGKLFKTGDTFIFANNTINATDFAPVLEGETAFVTNVNSPISELEIRGKIKAFDNEDGDVTSKIKLETDGYTVNKTKIGTYPIKYSVTDTAGNKAELTVHVLVKDITSPVITGTNKYTKSMSTLFSVDTIKTALSVTDNYNTGLSIVIETDNYTPNYNKVGSYNVVFKSTDSSGNIGRYTVTVTVIDDIKPSISGPKNIMKNQTEILTVSDIKSQLTANDNCDGIISNKITVKTDSYTGNGNKIGSYNIVFTVSDNAGNSTDYTFTVTVKDNIPPVFFVDFYFIEVPQSFNLTKDDIINLLTTSNQIAVSSQTSVTTIKNDYIGNENKIGMYEYSLKFSDTKGNESEKSVIINVVANKTDDVTILTPPTLGEKILSGIWFVIVWLWKQFIKFLNWIF